MRETVYKYALCVIKNNRLLMQEEEDEYHYVLPGGRAEDGEGAIQALCREIKEELGVELEIPTLQFIGGFEDVAADREDIMIHVDLYKGEFFGQVKPCSEVIRLVWLDKNDNWSRTTPVTQNKIMPFLIKKRLLI
jgi:8-oxo-dGTP diphosphatase